MAGRIAPKTGREGDEVCRLALTSATVVSGAARAVSGWCIPLLALVLLGAGCASAGQGPSATQGRQNLQSNCTRTLTRADEVPGALAAVSPGDTGAFPAVTLPTPR